MVFCNFGLLDRKEPSFLINVDKFKDDDGQPLQIPPMGRVLVMGGLGSILSRAIKDCRKENLIQGGENSKTFKMADPPRLTFKTSSIVANFAKADGNADKPGDKVQGTQVKPFSLDQQKPPAAVVESPQSKSNNLFSSLKIGDEQPFQDAAVSKEVPKNIDIFKLQGDKGLGAFKTAQPGEEKKEGFAMKTGNFGLTKSPSKPSLQPVAESKLLAMDEGKVKAPGKDSLGPLATIGGKPSLAEAAKESSKTEKPAAVDDANPLKPASKKAESIKTVEEALHKLKMDSELIKLVDHDKNFSKLDDIFRAIDLTLMKRGTADSSIGPSVPEDLWKRTIDTSVASIKTEREQLVKVRDQAFGLKQVCQDTGKLASLLLAKKDGRQTGAQLLSAVEHLDLSSQAKLEGMKRSLQKFAKVDMNLRSLLAAVSNHCVRVESAFNSSRDVPGKKPFTSAARSDLKKAGDTGGKQISMFGATKEKPIFGARTSLKPGAKPNWDLLKSGQSSMHITVSKESLPVAGLMSDRLKSEGQASQPRSAAHQGQQPAARLANSTSTWDAGRADPFSRPKEGTIQDYLGTYFALLEKELAKLESAAITNSEASELKPNVSISVAFLKDSVADRIAVESQNLLKVCPNRDLLGSLKSQPVNIEKKFRDFDMLVRKNLYLSHSFDLSLRRQLIADAESELIRDAKAYQEQSDREKQQLTAKQAANSAPQPKIGQSSGGLFAQEKKIGGSATLPNALGVAGLEIKADQKQESKVKNPVNPSLGGIFSGQAKPQADAGSEVKLDDKKETIPASEKDKQTALFLSQAKKPEDEPKKLSDMFNRSPDKTDKISTKDKEKPEASLLGKGLKTDSKDAPHQQTTGSLFQVGNPSKDLFGQNKENNSGQVFDLRQSQISHKSSGSGEDDEDDEDILDMGVGLKHSISQIGDSKSQSKQTDKLSKKDSELFSIKVDSKQAKDSPTTERPKDQQKSLFDASKTSNPGLVTGGLFQTSTTKEGPLFGNLASESQTANIFAPRPNSSAGGLFDTAGASKPLLNQANGAEKRPADKIENAQEHKPDNATKPGLFETAPNKQSNPVSTSLFPSNASKDAPKVGLFSPAPPQPGAGLSTGSAGTLFQPQTSSTTAAPGGGLFLGAPASLLSTSPSTNTGATQLNLDGGGMKALFSTNPSDNKPAFGQTSRLGNPTGGQAMGSSGFGSSSTAIGPINFTTGFGQPTAGSQQTATVSQPGNLFVQQTGQASSWMTSPATQQAGGQPTTGLNLANMNKPRY